MYYRSTFYYLFILPLFIFPAISVYAQQTVTIGAGASSGTSSNGSTGDPGPVYRSSASSSFDYSRHHYVYTQTELANAGLTTGAVITKLAWYKANTAASNGNYHFEIWLENSSLTAVQSPPQSWSTVTSGGTQVYNTNTQTMASATGFIDYTLTTPFTYTGGALEVSVAHDCHLISGSPFNAGISWKKDNISNRTISYVGSSSSTTLSNARTVRPQLRITYNSCTAPTGGNASNITTSSATVTWNTVSGSQGYEYVVDQSSSNPSGSGTNISTNSISPSGLSPNTTYYAHIRNKCNSTSYSSWITVSFTTFPSCSPTSGISFSNMTAGTLTLNWMPVSTSIGYEYVVDQSSASPSGNGIASSATSVNITGLTGNTMYYAHVRNICSPTDKSPWVNTSFTTKTCDKPVNVLISNVTDTSADILWSQMTNAHSYEYAVDFSNQPPVTGVQTTTGITAHMGGLIPNSKYYIHLRSKCFVTDKSGWRLDSFVTKMVCYAPKVQVNGLGTDAPNAYWDDVPTALAYEYELRNTQQAPAFGKTIYTTSVQLNLPADGKDYYLFVRAKCNSQFTFSVWTMAALRTGATAVGGIYADNEDIIAYPNPAHDRLYIRAGKNYSYHMTDMTGRQVLQGISDAAKGEIDIANLPPGMYMLRINTGTMEERITFSKQ